MSFPLLNDLQRERLKKNISLCDLSQSSGISESTLSKIFSGKQDDCRLTTISDIADSMGLEIRAVPEGSLENQPTNRPVDGELYDRLLDERGKLLQAKERIIQTQKTYVRVLFSILMAVMFTFAVLLILDRANGDWGYFRDPAPVSAVISTAPEQNACSYHLAADTVYHER